MDKETKKLLLRLGGLSLGLTVLTKLLLLPVPLAIEVLRLGGLL